MGVDLNYEDDRWSKLGLEALAGRAFSAVWAHLGHEGAFTISLLGCDDARIAGLNSAFRGNKQPTNVLSWPTEAREVAPGAVPPPPLDRELGDIAIAWETCVREARDQGKVMGEHVTHLLVHAMLHLLGYDHIDEKDAALMERIEVEVLGNLGISDPYRQ